MARARESRHMMSASSSDPFLLPKTEQGEVDWNTLGNTVTEHLLAELYHVSSVDRKFGATESVTEAAPSESNWHFDYDKDGIVVFKKRRDKNSRLTCFSGRGVVPAPYSVVAEFVKDKESAFLWDKYLMEANYLKTYAKTPTYTDYLGHQVYSTSHCFSLVQRDMLCFVRCHYIDGKYVQSAISIEDKDYPPQRFRPRCDVYLGTGFVVEPYRGSATTSLLTYFGNIDIKGLPLFLMNQVMRRHPLSILYIQRNFSSRPPSPEPLPTPPSTPHSPSPSSQPPSTLTSSTVKPYEEGLSLEMFMGRAMKPKHK